jgi:hypothetical protein
MIFGGRDVPWNVSTKILNVCKIIFIPKISNAENWSFGDLVLANCLQQRFAIAYQYFWVLVQNTTLNGDKNQKKPIVTPGGAECGF